MKFVDKEHISEVLEIFANESRIGYYAKMASAWGISVCCVKFPAETLNKLKEIEDKDILIKSIRKIIDSRRIKKSIKEIVKAELESIKNRNNLLASR